MPVPGRRGASASRGFEIAMRRKAPSRAASIRIWPPSSRSAMPWVTAFSTSGCSRRGGTTHERASSSATITCERRSPKRTFSIESSRSASASSSASVIASREPNVRLWRRKSASPTHSRRASSGFAAISALIEFRLLKRKCGWICARSARSSASRELISNCSARRSAACEAPTAISR